MLRAIVVYLLAALVGVGLALAVVGMASCGTRMRADRVGGDVEKIGVVSGYNTYRLRDGGVTCYVVIETGIDCVGG